MSLVRKYDHLFQKLRKREEIPLRQPLLDYGFGANSERYKKLEGWLPQEFWQVLAESINIFPQGYPLLDRDFYLGQDTVPPKGEHWAVLEEDGYWVALWTRIPSWLEKVGKERKQERDAIMERKRYEYLSKTAA